MITIIPAVVINENNLIDLMHALEYVFQPVKELDQGFSTVINRDND